MLLLSFDYIKNKFMHWIGSVVIVCCLHERLKTLESEDNHIKVTIRYEYWIFDYSKKFHLLLNAFLNTWQAHVFRICTLFWIRKWVRSTSHPNGIFSFTFCKIYCPIQRPGMAAQKGIICKLQNPERTGKEQVCCLFLNFV